MLTDAIMFLYISTRFDNLSSILVPQMLAGEGQISIKTGCI